MSSPPQPLYMDWKESYFLGIFRFQTGCMDVQPMKLLRVILFLRILLGLHAWFSASAVSVLKVLSIPEQRGPAFLLSMGSHRNNVVSPAQFPMPVLEHPNSTLLFLVTGFSEPSRVSLAMAPDISVLGDLFSAPVLASSLVTYSSFNTLILQNSIIDKMFFFYLAVIIGEET